MGTPDYIRVQRSGFRVQGRKQAASVSTVFVVPEPCDLNPENVISFKP
jgi:hypothetical protein